MKYVISPDRMTHNLHFLFRSVARIVVVSWLSLLTLTALVLQVDAHGRLMDPPARNSMWRLGFNNPVNYNDNELYCGGRMVQWIRNGGKCGVCGDAYHGQREHEAGGKYANGIISRTYTEGGVMPVTVHLTANHQGWFEVRVCPVNDAKKAVTQECLDKHVLQRTDGGSVQYPVPKGKYNAFFNYTLQLPPDLTCSQCVVQWKYRTGNTWDKDDNSGVFCLGCGPQEEFYNCADIEILPDKAKKTKAQMKHDSKKMLTRHDATAGTERKTTKQMDTKEVTKGEKSKEGVDGSTTLLKTKGGSEDKKEGLRVQVKKGGADGKKEGHRVENRKGGANEKKGGAEGKNEKKEGQTVEKKMGGSDVNEAGKRLATKKSGAGDRTEEDREAATKKGGADGKWEEQSVSAKKGVASDEWQELKSGAGHGSSKPREASYSWHAASPLSWAISPRRYVPRYSVITTTATTAAATTTATTTTTKPGVTWRKSPLNPFTPPPGATRRPRPSSAYNSRRFVAHPRTNAARETATAKTSTEESSDRAPPFHVGSHASKRPAPPLVTPTTRPSADGTDRTSRAATPTTFAPTPASSVVPSSTIRSPFSRPRPKSTKTTPSATTMRIRSGWPAGHNERRQSSSVRNSGNTETRDNRGDGARSSRNSGTDQLSSNSSRRHKSTSSSSSSSSTDTRRHAGRMPKWLVRVAKTKGHDERAAAAETTTTVPKVRAETYSIEARRQRFRQKLWRHLQRIKTQRGESSSNNHGAPAKPESAVENEAKSNMARSDSTDQNTARSEVTAQNRTKSNAAKSRFQSSVNLAQNRASVPDTAQKRRSEMPKPGRTARQDDRRSGGSRSGSTAQRDAARSGRSRSSGSTAQRDAARSGALIRSGSTAKDGTRLLSSGSAAQNTERSDASSSTSPRVTPSCFTSVDSAGHDGQSSEHQQQKSDQSTIRAHRNEQLQQQQSDTRRSFAHSSRSQTPSQSRASFHNGDSPFASSRDVRGNARVFARSDEQRLNYRDNVDATGSADGRAGETREDVFRPVLQPLSARSDGFLRQLQPLSIDGDRTLMGSGDGGLWWDGYHRDVVWAPVPVPAPKPRLHPTPSPLLRSAPGPGPGPASVTPSSLRCRAIVRLGGGMDDWCTANCNANYCPTGMCVCQRLPQPQQQQRVHQQQQQQQQREDEREKGEGTAILPFSPPRGPPVRYRLVREDQPTQRGSVSSSWITPYRNRVPFSGVGFASNRLTLQGSGSASARLRHPDNNNNNNNHNPLPSTGQVYGGVVEDAVVAARPFVVTYAPFAIRRQHHQRSREEEQETEEEQQQQQQQKGGEDQEEEEERRLVVGGVSGWGRSRNQPAPAVLCRAVGRYAGLAHYDNWCSNNCAQAMCPLFMCTCDTF